MRDFMNKQARIIVVEDELLSRDMLVRRLASRNFDVIGFPTAHEALAHMEEYPADLILMDNALPNMSGVDAVRLLRQRWSHDSLPILMVSAMIDSEDVVEALEAGANDYVIKPINFKVLLARINTALQLKHNVSMLVEAERQRVMIESLSHAAASVAEPLGKMVDELEAMMNRPDSSRSELRQSLNTLLDLTEQAVDVIDQLRRIASLHHVPYTTRLDFLKEVGTTPEPNGP
jgi:DNA-binding response OmpR family regulator